MKVRIIQEPREPLKVIALAAKLCYSAEPPEKLLSSVRKEEPPEKFVRMLLDMGHESPIEHVSWTFLITGISRACSHQLVRHRLASYSQRSQRYVKEEEFRFVTPPSVILARKGRWYEEQMRKLSALYAELNEALGESGEESQQDARFILPNACETHLVVTMNARSLRHFFTMRCCERAQWEIRELADEMLRQLKERVPVLFDFAGPACLRGRCPEGGKSCGKVKEVKRKYLGR
jgi:thymidylate synthase (FAD)